MNPRIVAAAALTVLGALTAPAGAQSAADAACIKCHKDTGRSEVVHAPMKDGCVKCHSALDASVTPHRSTNKIKGGVSAKGADHCYACHDKAAYAKKTRHAAIRRECTGCHDPHASKQEALLTEAPDKLCFKCHERDDFNAQFVHEPIKEGSCSACHNSHASDETVLLSRERTKLCLTCHKDVRKKPHAVSGFSQAGHPIGGEKPGVMNPANPKEPFYCGSCHDPHKSKHATLSRFDPNDTKVGYCQQCHKM